MKVSALITNYNTWPLTARCISELEHWSGSALTSIVIVDDASLGVSPANLSNSIRVIRNPENRGYVACVNIGFSNLGDDVVLLLDSDAYPLMDLVPRIIEHFENEPRLGALGFLEINGKGKTRIAGDLEPTLTQFLLGQALGSWFGRRGWFTGERFVLHSCCMAVRRQAFQEIGGFDEEFDFLDADTDFSMRLQDAGWQIEVDTTLKSFHQGSGSPQTTMHRVIRFHRNRWLLLRKHGRVRLASACRLTLMLRHAMELTILALYSVLRLSRKDDLQNKRLGRRQLLLSVMNDYAVAHEWARN